RMRPVVWRRKKHNNYYWGLMKHQVPTKGKGFREMFKKVGFDVFLCNEFLTSSICPVCKKRSLETFK
ncbi:hypothetical protein HK099_005814, partial [Clydaea vesicula]